MSDYVFLGYHKKQYFNDNNKRLIRHYFTILPGDKNKELQESSSLFLNALFRASVC